MKLKLLECALLASLFFATTTAHPPKSKKATTPAAREGGDLPSTPKTGSVKRKAEALTVQTAGLLTVPSPTSADTSSPSSKRNRSSGSFEGLTPTWTPRHSREGWGVTTPSSSGATPRSAKPPEPSTKRLLFSIIGHDTPTPSEFEPVELEEKREFLAEYLQDKYFSKPTANVFYTRYWAMFNTLTHKEKSRDLVFFMPNDSLNRLSLSADIIERAEAEQLAMTRKFLSQGTDGAVFVVDTERDPEFCALAAKEGRVAKAGGSRYGALKELHYKVTDDEARAKTLRTRQLREVSVVFGIGPKLLKHAHPMTFLSHSMLDGGYELISAPPGLATLSVFADGGSVFGVIRAAMKALDESGGGGGGGGGHIPMEFVLRVAASGSLALARLHAKAGSNNGLVHGDLKPDNLLLDIGGQVLVSLTDFGGSAMLNKDGKVVGGRGSPGYIAHECVFEGELVNDHRTGLTFPVSDIFSLGAILYQLTDATFASTKTKFVRDPQTGAVHCTHLEWNMAEHFKQEQLYEQLKDLIWRTLTSDYNLRLGAKGIEYLMAHPLFAGFDWKGFVKGEGPTPSILPVWIFDESPSDDKSQKKKKYRFNSQHGGKRFLVLTENEEREWVESYEAELPDRHPFVGRLYAYHVSYPDGKEAEWVLPPAVPSAQAPQPDEKKGKEKA